MSSNKKDQIEDLKAQKTYRDAEGENTEYIDELIKKLSKSKSDKQSNKK